MLVVHDWGSALGFDWARRHRTPSPASPTWRRSSGPSRWTSGRSRPGRVFEAFRTDAGEQMVLDKNVFVERVLPGRCCGR